MKAAALKKGDTIGVMATSNWVSQEDLDKAKTYIEGLGYKVLIHPQATERLNQSAGTAQSKVNAFHDLVKNPKIRAIFGARGGNRAITMIDKIDFNAVVENPKIIIGYSDLTVLINSINQQTGLVTFHGPVFRDLPTHKDTAHMLDLLSGGTPAMDFSGSRVFKEGNAEGPLIGGNLSMLMALSGTPWQPDTTGAILFIEDVGDHMSRYDRMLAHLRLAGWFNHISGLVVGGFTETGQDKGTPFGFTLDDSIGEHLAGLNIPIVMDAPFGHGDKLYTLPVGGKAKLETANGKAALTLTAPAVK